MADGRILGYIIIRHSNKRRACDYMRDFSKTDLIALKRGYQYHIYVGNGEWKDKKLLLSIKYDENKEIYVVKNWKANKTIKIVEDIKLNNLLRKVITKYGSYGFVITRREENGKESKGR